MLRLVRNRLLVSIPLFVLVTLVTFVLTALIPGDPARQILGAEASSEQVAQLREALGLNRSIIEQYGNWLVGAVQGDLGRSIISSQPVTDILGPRIAPTASLIILATLAAAIIGIAFGILGATGGRTMGRLVDGFSVVGMALPNFWIGLLLIAVFAVSLRVLPATGYVSIERGVGPWILALILPVATLTISNVASIAKQTRDAMVNALASESVAMLRASGISRSSIVFRHALKNSAVPVITVIGLLFVSLLSGTVAVEVVFGLPGLGSAAVAASLGGDLPTMQGVVLYFTIIVIVVNLIVDVAYGWLNPKVRTS